MTGLFAIGALGIIAILVALPLIVGGLVWWGTGSWVAGLVAFAVLAFGGTVIRWVTGAASTTPSRVGDPSAP